MTEYILYDIDKQKLSLVPEDSVLDSIYNMKFNIPTVDNVKKYLKEKTAEKKIVKFFEGKFIEEGIEQIRKNISKIGNKIPLYDIFSKTVFLVPRRSVYGNIIYRYQRFPSKSVLEYFKGKFRRMKGRFGDFKNIKNMTEYQVINKAKYDKLKFIIYFLSIFDLDIMHSTYIQAFYDSNDIGKNLILCPKKSFLPHFKHIKPYYKKDELINLAKNMKLIKKGDIIRTADDVMKLCEKVTASDIDADIILYHQVKIILSNKVGLIQYYSFNGSYFINNYLRGLVSYKYKNRLLESIIRSIWELINDAPKFDKEYILYRFIKDDEHLQDLTIGDIYTSPGFISTTRNPFYSTEGYEFGMILIKIKIPPNISGIALCMETVSLFPEEEEIILSPQSRLRLDKKDSDVAYYHPDYKYSLKVRTKYEMTFVGKNEISFVDRPVYSDDVILDFLKLDAMNFIGIDEKAKVFVKNYVSPYYQFKTMIGNHKVKVSVEWYNSSSVYGNFYSLSTNNGFSLFCVGKNSIVFFIELGDTDEGTVMSVNYYHRYSTADHTYDYKDVEFTKFISSVAHFFRVQHVYIYADYVMCGLTEELRKTVKLEEIKQTSEKQDAKLKHSEQIKLFFGGNYCQDFYNYIKHGVKKYDSIDPTILKAKFSYFALDQLKKIKISDILSREDSDNIYDIYEKVYKINYPLDKQQNIADFYIWIIENNCYLIDIFMKKISKMYSRIKTENPFDIAYYKLDSAKFLYDNNYIDNYPFYMDKKKQFDDRLIIKTTKNEYRLSERDR